MNMEIQVRKIEDAEHCQLRGDDGACPYTKVRCLQASISENPAVHCFTRAVICIDHMHLTRNADDTLTQYKLQHPMISPSCMVSHTYSHDDHMVFKCCQRRTTASLSTPRANLSPEICWCSTTQVNRCVFCPAKWHTVWCRWHRTYFTKIGFYGALLTWGPPPRKGLANTLHKVPKQTLCYMDSAFNSPRYPGREHL